MCNHDRNSPSISRRGFVTAAAALAGSVAASGWLTGAAHAQQAASPRRRLLFKGGTVLTMDRALGDLARGDVLVENGRIAAVGQNLSAADAQTVNCANMIVMPGFVDTHRHMWEGQIRNTIPEATLAEYLKIMLAGYGTAYRPQDAYIGDLLSAYSALDAGVTTVLDWSHVQNSPAHADEIIRALKESGIRAVFAYGMPELGGKPWWADEAAHKYPGDIKRLRAQYFNSEDQLLTLALAASGGFGNMQIAAREWGAAREVGARVSIHAGGKGQIQKFASAFKLGPDTTYVHCAGWDETDWKMVADSGGTVSISPGTETFMSMNISPFQNAIDAGLKPSLSVDAESNAPTDMFSEMRAALTVQHTMLMARRGTGEEKLPPHTTAREALEWATIDGAKANGLERKCGSLAVGKDADVILLRKDKINVMPVNDPVAAVVYGMDTSNIDSVYVAGRARKLNGRLVGADLKRLARQAEESRRYLMEKVKRS
jgi:cytosine/adenosine deaminase-related metal-dependent hydrolase